MKLTAAVVRSAGIPPGKSEAIFFDDDVPGFGFRVREAGRGSFVFQYKLGSQAAAHGARRCNRAQFRRDAQDRRNALRSREARARPGRREKPRENKGHRDLRGGRAPASSRTSARRCARAPLPRSSGTCSSTRSRCTSCQFEKITRQDIAACVRSVTRQQRHSERQPRQLIAVGTVHHGR